MENKKIKLKITTISSSNPVSVIKGEGSFKRKDEKTLITFTDSENVKTSFIITENRIMLSRTSSLYSLKIPVSQGEKMLGIMGEENTFTVIGKKAEFLTHKTGGSLSAHYCLPDLSDEPTDFEVEVEFTF